MTKAIDDTSFVALRANAGEAPENNTLVSAANGVLPEQSFLMQLWHIAWRRKWTLIIIMALAILLGGALTMLMTRKYTAASTIQIARDDTKILNVQGVRSEVTTADREFYQTQYGLLQSRALAERVVRDQRLLADPMFRSTYRLDDGKRQLNAAEQIATARDIVLGGIKIIPVRDSGLVNIQYTSTNPALAAKIANAWGEAFVASNIQRGFDESAFARKYLENRLEQTRKRLEETERAAVDYASKEGIFKLSQSGSDGKSGPSERSVKESELAAYTDALNKAVADRIAAEATYRAGIGGSPDAADTTTPLRQRRAELAAEYKKMLVQFEPTYPAAKALAEQIAQLDQSIATEGKRERSGQASDLRAKYTAALSREAALRSQVAEVTAALLSERRSTIQYNINEREVDTNRQLYDALLQRYKEVGVAGGVNRSNVSIVDQAEVPGAPSSPNLMLNLLLASFLGALVGLGAIVIQEQVDDVISDPESVERRLGYPLLGTIPEVDSSYENPFAALKDPKSDFTEAYLSLRTTLSFTTEHGVPKTLSITSTRPAEGKSISALALAALIGSNGKRVLLIDCDMRLPSVNDHFRWSNTRGLSNALSGDDDLASLIQRADGLALDVMTAGPTPPNAAELLASKRFGNVLAKLGEHYDHIVCDGPPVISIADALLLASQVEGTIYVVESHRTHINAVRTSLQRLAGVNARILGVAMTRYDPKQSSYSYAYSYGYGYGARHSDEA